MPDHKLLADHLAQETGLSLVATAGVDAERQPWILLRPEGENIQHTFGVRLTIGWRRLWITLEPGTFAGPLLQEMAGTDADGRSVFRGTLGAARAAGADITFRLNGKERDVTDDTIWDEQWTRVHLELRKGGLELGDADGKPDQEILQEWAELFMAAVVAILPVEMDEQVDPVDHQTGFPEGAAVTVTVNRYERDRRNRVAAIAIHGSRCKGCGLDFGERYGKIAAGFIEVHHVVPVSKMTPGYVVDPRVDLVPLCSNCHSVVHRQDPPLGLVDLQKLLGA